MSDAPHPALSSPSPLPRSLQVWRGVLSKADMAVSILRTPGFLQKRTNDDDDDDEAIIAGF